MGPGAHRRDGGGPPGLDDFAPAHWGVPIALFVHRETGEPHPRSVELMRKVAERVEQGGVDAWYSLDAAELIGDEARDYDKITDIPDVWF